MSDEPKRTLSAETISLIAVGVTVLGVVMASWADSRASIGELRTGIAGLRVGQDQLRSEFREEFHAVRSEFREEFHAVRSEFRKEFHAVRSEFRKEFDSVRSEFREDLGGLRSDLKGEMREARMSAEKIDHRLRGLEVSLSSVRTHLTATQPDSNLPGPNGDQTGLLEVGAPDDAPDASHSP